MPVVQLNKIGDENLSLSFNNGEHILGRGPALSCDTKKVSRKHGLLNVSDNGGVVLRSIHNNPCLYRSYKTNLVSMIAFGNSVQLNNNDKIALCLDHGWFSVKIEGFDNDNDNTNHADEKRKRDQADESPHESTKKIKVEAADEPLTTAETATNQENPDEQVSAIKEEANEFVLDLENIPIEFKFEPDETATGEVQANEVKEEEGAVKTEEEQKDADGPSTSGTSRVWRDKCWYGKHCYRKNVQHRAQLRHFGDADYDSDPDDQRPICCYGAGCYRRNLDHRRKYRHPGQDAVSSKPKNYALPKRRTRKPKPKKPPPSQSDHSDEDSYDLTDPFLNDDSSDEYEPTSDSDTESDYEDENSEELLSAERKRAKKK